MFGIFIKIPNILIANINIFNINIRNKYVRYFYKKILLKVVLIGLNFLAKIKIISSCYASREILKGFSVEGTSYEHRKGFFPILFVYPGFFQSEKFFKKENLMDLKIKSQYLDKANIFLNEMSSGIIFFVHIRMGDYIDYVVLGKKDSRLPFKYYQKQIKSLQKKNKKCSFVFLTDDLDYVRENFNWVENSAFSKESVFVDFAIMTLCDGGIMSNSSFSWWGSYFNSDSKILIAPKYWTGFKSGIEFPKGISPSFADVVNI